jgi:excisionase family DNA binding protein
MEEANEMDPVTVTIEGARKALGIGNTKLYELIGSKKLRTVKLGRRTLVRTDSIRALVDELEAA